MSPTGANDNNFLMLMHLSQLADLILPPAGLIIPLVMWLSNRQKPGVDAHGKEIANWMIFLLGLVIICVPLFFCGIGFVLLGAIVIGEIVFPIIGAVKASKGEFFRYPMPFRLIK